MPAAAAARTLGAHGACSRPATCSAPCGRPVSQPASQPASRQAPRAPARTTATPRPPRTWPRPRAARQSARSGRRPAAGGAEWAGRGGERDELVGVAGGGAQAPCVSAPPWPASARALQAPQRRTSSSLPSLPPCSGASSPSLSSSLDGTSTPFPAPSSSSSLQGRRGAGERGSGKGAQQAVQRAARVRQRRAAGCAAGSACCCSPAACWAPLPTPPAHIQAHTPHQLPAAPAALSSGPRT